MQLSNQFSYKLHTHAHTRKSKNGQTLSPPSHSKSNLKVSSGDTSPASRDKVSMSYVETYDQRYNPHGAWPETFRCTKTQLWDWTPRPTSTRLLHDVTIIPVVMSTPINDQVLIYIPELREASLCNLLLTVQSLSPNL